MLTLKDIIDNILDTYDYVYNCEIRTCADCKRNDFCYIETIFISIDNIDKY